MNRQEMTEGSDGTGSEMGGIEMTRGRDDGWSVVRQNNKKKRKKRGQQNDRINTEGTDSEDNVTLKAGGSEYKIIIKLSQDSASFGEWNPIQLTKLLFKLVGEVKNAKVL